MTINLQLIQSYGYNFDTHTFTQTSIYIKQSDKQPQTADHLVEVGVS